MRDQAPDFDTPEEADFDAHIKGANFDALKTPTFILLVFRLSAAVSFKGYKQSRCVVPLVN